MPQVWGWSKVSKVLDKSINIAPILFSLSRLLFQFSKIFNNDAVHYSSSEIPVDIWKIYLMYV